MRNQKPSLGWPSMESPLYRQREIRLVEGTPWAFWTDQEQTLWISRGESPAVAVRGQRTTQFWPYFRDRATISVIFSTPHTDDLFQMVDSRCPQQTKRVGRGRLLRGASTFGLFEVLGNLVALRADECHIIAHTDPCWRQLEIACPWATARDHVWWTVAQFRDSNWVLGYHPRQGVFRQPIALPQGQWPTLVVSREFLYLAWWQTGFIHGQVRDQTGWPEVPVQQYFQLGPADAVAPALWLGDGVMHVEWLSNGHLVVHGEDRPPLGAEDGPIRCHETYLSFEGQCWSHYAALPDRAGKALSMMKVARPTPRNFSRVSSARGGLPKSEEPVLREEPGPSPVSIKPTISDDKGQTERPAIRSGVMAHAPKRCLPRLKKFSRDFCASWRTLSKPKQ